MLMKDKKLNYIGMLIVLGFCLLFYILATFFLDRHTDKNENKVNNDNEIIYNKEDYSGEINIISSLYRDARILYDVVNNKFRVDQDEVIVIGDITYKRINNFYDVMGNIFTEDGIKKYISDLDGYFAYKDDEFYLAGNLVSYQTYYFRGDNTNIYITSSSEEYINGIIYERWTSNNRNTLATIRVKKVNDNWLIDDITLLSTEQSLDNLLVKEKKLYYN